jgi:hypothetical protein
MISSTEVRRRITEVKEEARLQIEKQASDNGPVNGEEAKHNQESLKHNQAILQASLGIGGLVTKSTIEFIRANNLY